MDDGHEQYSADDYYQNVLSRFHFAFMTAVTTSYLFSLLHAYDCCEPVNTVGIATGCFEYQYLSCRFKYWRMK